MNNITVKYFLAFLLLFSIGISDVSYGYDYNRGLSSEIFERNRGFMLRYNSLTDENRYKVDDYISQKNREYQLEIFKNKEMTEKEKKELLNTKFMDSFDFMRGLLFTQ